MKNNTIFTEGKGGNVVKETHKAEKRNRIE